MKSFYMVSVLFISILTLGCGKKNQEPTNINYQLLTLDENVAEYNYQRLGVGDFNFNILDNGDSYKINLYSYNGTKRSESVVVLKQFCALDVNCEKIKFIMSGLYSVRTDNPMCIDCVAETSVKQKIVTAQTQKTYEFYNFVSNDMDRYENAVQVYIKKIFSL